MSSCVVISVVAVNRASYIMYCICVVHSQIRAVVQAVMDDMASERAAGRDPLKTLYLFGAYTIGENECA